MSYANNDGRVGKHTMGALNVAETAPSHEQHEAQRLLKRAPNSYAFNQIYGFWLYLSLFLFTILLTRSVPTNEYGIFVGLQAATNTIIYLAAIGLEDATATFIPRVLAEQGPAAAAQLFRRLLGLRLGILAVCIAVLLFGLPVLASLIAALPVPGTAQVAATLKDPVLLAHTQPMAVYVLGNGLANLFITLYAAQMRMQWVLLLGSLTQLALLALGFVALQAGWGVDGVLWMQALTFLCSGLAFACWQAPFIFKRRSAYIFPFKPVIRLSISAWLTNLASGALVKQIAIILLSIFSIQVLKNTYIAYFSLAFQMADAANVLLVSGFAGVGGSSLAVAFVGQNHERLGLTWQVLIKVETLLAAPGLVFCLFNATNIITAIYGEKYAAVGPLLAIFLFFNIFVRIFGTTIHQSSLYVIGKPILVVLSQWSSLIILIIIGIILIPSLGPAGALIADGIAKALAGALLLLFLLPTLPRKYPLELLRFTVRFLLALLIAALPSILWHPADRFLLVLSGLLFIVLCLGLLLVIKPLSASDIEMINNLSPKLAPYLRGFARK